MPNEDTKYCKRCDTHKPHAGFSMRGDKSGLKTYCKPCTNAVMREYAARNRESRREYFRRWWDGKNEIRKEKDRERYNPIKARARRMVKDALRAGTMTRQPCAVCGSSQFIEAHHTDYSRPLDVLWLCSLHHKDVHFGRLDVGQLQVAAE